VTFHGLRWLATALVILLVLAIVSLQQGLLASFTVGSIAASEPSDVQDKTSAPVSSAVAKAAPGGPPMVAAAAAVKVAPATPSVLTPRPIYPHGDGGCYNIKDRQECCKWRDGRYEHGYGGRDCVPARPGASMAWGNICEPKGESHNAAGECPDDARPPAQEPPAVTSPRAVEKDSNKKYPYKIYTYWNYGRGPDEFVKINQETWRAHAPPGTEIVLVNDTNFRKLVPDTPDEVFRMPYAAAFSDIVRAAVLYHHGGLYMDADFLVLGPLSEIFDKLDEGWDIVVYTDGGGTSGPCGSEGFSSNFMAGRKHNPFSSVWWSNIKSKVTRLCDEGEFTAEKICCHEAYASEPERRRCHIPWGHLEWLKIPSADADLRPLQLDPTQNKQGYFKKSSRRQGPDAEKIAERVAKGNVKSMQWPAKTRYYCMRGAEGMAPHLNGEVYWQPWNSKTKATQEDRSGGSFDMRFACQERASGDLDCSKGNWGKSRRNFPRFFGRLAYHLFFSTKKPYARSRSDILETGYLLSDMYKRTLGLST